MKYQITSDNMQVTASMQNLVMSKMGKLEKLWGRIEEDLTNIRVVLNSAPGADTKFEVKIEANVKGEIYYADGIGYSFEEALVSAVNKVERSVLKDTNKTKKWDRVRDAKVVSEDDLVL